MAKSPSGSRCDVDLADVVTIGGLDLGEQNAGRADDGSHGQCEYNVRVCRLHEIPRLPRSSAVVCQQTSPIEKLRVGVEATFLSEILLALAR